MKSSKTVSSNLTSTRVKNIFIPGYLALHPNLLFANRASPKDAIFGCRPLAAAQPWEPKLVSFSFSSSSRLLLKACFYCYHSISIAKQCKCSDSNKNKLWVKVGRRRKRRKGDQFWLPGLRRRKRPAAKN